MKKFSSFILLTLILLGISSLRLRAEEKLPAKLQQLTDEAYRAYSAREMDNYFETVKKVKDATKFSQYQETYYRACSYEAIYMFEYVDRLKALLRNDLGTARETSETIHKAVEEFVGSAEPSDDLTKMCIKMR